MSYQQCKNGRWYQLDNGTWAPSVTTVLSVWPRGRSFEKWLGDSDSYDDAIAKRDAAGERGSVVHDAIAALLQSGVATLPDECDTKTPKLVNGFLNWYHDTYPMVVSAEKFLVGLDYAGTADLICTINDVTWLIDFKTSGAVYDSYHVQVCAYARAWEHMGLPSIDRRGILWLKSTTKRGYQMVESPHTEEEDWAAFRSCRALFHYINGDAPEFYEEKAAVSNTFRLEEE